MTEMTEPATAGFYVKTDAEGTPFLAFTASEGNIQVNLALARNENADEIIAAFTQQMKAARADLRRMASGLVEVKGVIPDGLSKGRIERGSRRKG